MKTAMIWGASGGIGRALLDALTADGWTTIAVSRHPAQLEGVAAHSLEADVTDEFDVKNAVMSASYEVDNVDLWIYAAGDITSAKVGALESSGWERILGANLTGAYLTTHHSLPLLADDAHMFFLGAVSERLRLPGLAAYAAAKAGLEAFVDALRKEERRCKVTIVRPGAVDTLLWEKVPMSVPKDAAPPAKVASRILQAYAEGTKGTLDLT